MTITCAMQWNGWTIHKERWCCWVWIVNANKCTFQLCFTFVQRYLFLHFCVWQPEMDGHYWTQSLTRLIISTFANNNTRGGNEMSRQIKCWKRTDKHFFLFSAIFSNWMHATGDADKKLTPFSGLLQKSWHLITPLLQLKIGIRSWI